VKRIQIHGFASPAVQFLVGVTILAMVTAASFKLGFNHTSVALIFLIAIGLVSLFGHIIPALAVTIVAAGPGGDRARHFPHRGVVHGGTRWASKEFRGAAARARPSA
jgi:hypothetical protein